MYSNLVGFLFHIDYFRVSIYFLENKVLFALCEAIIFFYIKAHLLILYVASHVHVFIILMESNYSFPLHLLLFVFF